MYSHLLDFKKNKNKNDEWMNKKTETTKLKTG